MKIAPKIIPACMLFAAFTFILTANGAVSIRIDGDFSDWQDAKTLARDPKGDARGAFDITRVYVTNRGTSLYIRFDTGSILNIQNGPNSEGTLLITFELPNHKQLIVDTRGRQAFLSDHPDERIPWAHLKYIVGPTYAQDEFEIQLDLSIFGVRMGDSVTLQFDGSDRLDAPVTYTLSLPSPKPEHRSSHRQPGTDVRIVSFNTYVEGLSDPNRAPALKRLLNAADGDIYCFQEEWESTGIDKTMNRLVPLDKGRVWHVHKVHGSVIVSKYPLTALPSSNRNYAAACIDLNGKPLVVMSVHLSAMGYINSKQDLWRIQQAKAILETLRGVYEGAYDDCVPPDTKPGFVLVGDFNLVGSRTPADLLISPKAVGLTNWILPNLVGESVITWRGGLNTSFSPGKLDYTLYSKARLTPKNGFVLNSELLNQTELDHLELITNDSKMSDHLLMVLDFQLAY